MQISKASYFFKGVALFAAPFFLVVICMLLGILELSSISNLTMLQGLNAIVIYPVLEEVIFRGFLLEEFLLVAPFKKKYFSISIANIVCSLLFAISHGLFFMDWSALLVFLPSLLIGYLYEERRNLISAIALHSWYNFISLLFIPLW